MTTPTFKKHNPNGGPPLDPGPVVILNDLNDLSVISDYPDEFFEVIAISGNDGIQLAVVDKMALLTPLRSIKSATDQLQSMSEGMEEVKSSLNSVGDAIHQQDSAMDQIQSQLQDGDQRINDILQAMRSSSEDMVALNRSLQNTSDDLKSKISGLGDTLSDLDSTLSSTDKVLDTTGKAVSDQHTMITEQSSALGTAKSAIDLLKTQIESLLTNIQTLTAAVNTKKSVVTFADITIPASALITATVGPKTFTLACPGLKITDKGNLSILPKNWAANYGLRSWDVPVDGTLVLVILCPILALGGTPLVTGVTAYR